MNSTLLASYFVILQWLPVVLDVLLLIAVIAGFTAVSRRLKAIHRTLQAERAVPTTQIPR